MKQIIDFLSKAQAFFVATVDAAGRPQVRPFGFVMEWEGRLTFATSTEKEVYKQMAANPHIAVSAFIPAENRWIRISGEVKLFHSVEANREALRIMPPLASIYGSAENPVLACIAVERGTAEIYDFASGFEPVETVELGA